VVLSLEAGWYAILCFVELGDRVPHLAKGMIRELVVVAGKASKGPEPRADALMVLEDYGFAVTPGLTAGRRTIRVESRGPPPGEPFGGTAALQTGGVNYVTADFPKCDYALFCFVPDAGDGRRHVGHGMVGQIRVN
jgi:hypothetical protein